MIIPSVSLLPNAPVLRATEQWANSRQALQRQGPVLEGLCVGQSCSLRGDLVIAPQESVQAQRGSDLVCRLPEERQLGVLELQWLVPIDVALALLDQLSNVGETAGTAEADERLHIFPLHGIRVCLQSTSVNGTSSHWGLVAALARDCRLVNAQAGIWGIPPQHAFGNGLQVFIVFIHEVDG